MELPVPLLVQIFSQLETLAELIRCGCVCRAWRRVVVDAAHDEALWGGFARLPQFPLDALFAQHFPEQAARNHSLSFLRADASLTRHLQRLPQPSCDWQPYRERPGRGVLEDDAAAAAAAAAADSRAGRRGKDEEEERHMIQSRPWLHIAGGSPAAADAAASAAAGAGQASCRALALERARARRTLLQARTAGTNQSRIMQEAIDIGFRPNEPPSQRAWGGCCGPCTPDPADPAIQKSRVQARRFGPHQASLKTCMLGDSGVGKSSVARRLVQDTFLEDECQTIGASFMTKRLWTSGDGGAPRFEARLELWDTAGQERYGALAPMYYRGAGLVVVVVSVTDRASLDRAHSFLREVRDHNVECLCVLVANKVDGGAEGVGPDTTRQVSYAELCALAAAHALPAPPLEVSAKTGLGITQAFQFALDAVNTSLSSQLDWQRAQLEAAISRVDAACADA